MSARIEHWETIVLGAGAAGMMCAIHAAARGGRVLVLDHAKAPGEKIRISGGGRCNFTNLNTTPENFLSANPHFCKSALGRYSPYDFLDLVEAHGIAWQEKTQGQLFCDHSAKDIIAMLLDEMHKAGAVLRLHASIHDVSHADGRFDVQTSSGALACKNLVVATGGKSIPKMGATGFGYALAEQFGHTLTETRPALVPLTFGDTMKTRCAALSGVSAPARVSCGEGAFEDALLFTHRGLSGPSILQVSSFWREGAELQVTLAPHTDLFAELSARRRSDGRKAVSTVLGDLLPKRLADDIVTAQGIDGTIGGQSDARLRILCDALTDWRLKPTGSEGYRTAEVTLGGVETDGLNARTLESRKVHGLYFIGEVVDVTGWLGGYNFQWAWASGWAAGTAIAESCA